MNEIILPHIWNIVDLPLIRYGALMRCSYISSGQLGGKNTVQAPKIVQPNPISFLI